MRFLKHKLVALFAIFSLVILSGIAVSAQTSGFTQVALEKQVRKELVTLPYVGVFDNLEYKVEGSTVTLYGQVVRPTSKSDAGRRVAKLNGVTKVVNNIEVLPLSNFDDQIRFQTLRALANRGGLYRYLQGTNPSLRIIVNNGHIALEGIVANRGDFNLANITANGVSGVFSVKNNLRIENELTR
jgi:hyperosmotically inducible periplasmic protein